jgi:hypothetical protein
MPFQSGLVDVVTFKGSKLQRIKEVWVGLESGTFFFTKNTVGEIPTVRAFYKFNKGALQEFIHT